jgi:hypothetical protein
MVIKARHLFTYQSTVMTTKEQAFSDRIGHIALFHGNALNFLKYNIINFTVFQPGQNGQVAQLVLTVSSP